MSDSWSDGIPNQPEDPRRPSPPPDAAGPARPVDPRATPRPQPPTSEPPATEPPPIVEPPGDQPTTVLPSFVGEPTTSLPAVDVPTGPPPMEPPVAQVEPTGGSSGSGMNRGLLIGALVATIVALGGAAFVVSSLGDDDEAADATTTVAPTTTTDDAAPDTTSAPSTTVEESTTSTAAETTVAPGPATVADLARSTVQVILLDGGQPTCSGSGTIVEPDGTILTNAHVVEADAGCPYDTIGVAVTDDSGTPPELRYQARIHGFDRTLDLAVIRISGDLDGNPVEGSFAAVPLGDSDEVEIGDQLRILGYPSIGGDTVTFTRGVVSGFTAQTGVGDRSWIKTDATIAGGNSGGAAFDGDGRLIGVPTQAAASDDGPVVDCRVITDTNGDGRFTDEDQCVPIGGFLNGIRPVNLALPLLEEARDAAPIDLDDVDTGPDTAVDTSTVFTYNPSWSLLSSDDPGFEGEFVVTAAAGIGQLCIWFDWEGIPAGTLWDGIWLIDGEVEEAYSFFGVGWDLTTDGTDAWVCAIDEAGLVAGLYEFAFLVDEEIEFIESIRITPEAVPLHTVEFVNSSDRDLCFLYVAPLGASDTGLDELGRTDVIASGDRFSVLVPEGDIIADAYDCDFEPMYANYDGLPVAGPVVVDVTG